MAIASEGEEAGPKRERERHTRWCGAGLWAGPKLLQGTRSSSRIGFLASGCTPSSATRCGPGRYCCGSGTSQQVALRIRTPTPQACCLCLCRFARAGSASAPQPIAGRSRARIARYFGVICRNITATGHVCRAASACLAFPAFPAAHQNNFCAACKIASPSLAAGAGGRVTAYVCTSPGTGCITKHCNREHTV